MRKADDEQIMSMVRSAMTQPVGERESYIRTVCSGDVELLTQVLHYVLWEDRMKDFLDPGHRDPLPEEHPFSPGELVEGRFRIIREIAQGGMGVVFEAYDEKLERRIAIKWSVRERDMGSLVAEAMRKVDATVHLPEGYTIVWSGRFEDQQRALARLYVIVPLVIFIIFILLFGTFSSIGDALLIMLNLPFALIGGTLALFVSGTHFNISAAVGYVAVFGVSVLNGVVLVSSIRQARADGLPLDEAIRRGCALRFRPIVVSGIVAVIGFIPAALSHGIGSEIQRPLARVVIGGPLSSTLLTLLVLPAFYALVGRRSASAAPSEVEA